MQHISIRMKTTKDTRKECNRRKEMWQIYFEGRTRPHFPVPARINYLNRIAADPLTAEEDFNSIGWWGKWGIRR